MRLRLLGFLSRKELNIKEKELGEKRDIIEKLEVDGDKIEWEWGGNLKSRIVGNERREKIVIEKDVEKFKMKLEKLWLRKELEKIREIDWKMRNLRINDR